MSLPKQILLCLVLLAIAAGGWYVYRSPDMIGLALESASEDGPAAGGGNRIPGLLGAGGAVNVVTTPVVMNEGGETIIALGTAKAVRSVTLFPQVTGVVTEILFHAGERVEAGAILVRLEADEEQVALDRARVALAQANQTLARSQALAESRTISDAALIEAQTAAELAEIEVRAAEIALRRRNITAPFAGTTGLTDISVGDLVSNATEIVTLDDLSTIRVNFEVPERWAERIVPDQQIEATAQALPGAVFPGHITGIDNRIDETTRTLRLEAELENEGQALKTGMAVTVALHFESDSQLAVPTLAVQWDRRGSFVWRIAEDAAYRAEVTIIRRQSGLVIVQGDVVAGDVVVVEGIQRLREGARVEVVNQEPAMVDPPAEGRLPETGTPVTSGESASTRS